MAVIDWDGAALADIAMDWAALCANCPPEVVTAMREATPDAAELGTPRCDLPATGGSARPRETGGHPWLSGSVPVTEPRL